MKSALLPTLEKCMSTGTWKTLWSGPGGARQVLQISLPLIISTGFWTLQMTLDRVMLSRHDSAEVGAAQIAVMVFWTVFALLYNTSQYSATFVAQYLGAERPERVGPVIWQSLYFSLISGVVFVLVLWPASGWIVGLAGHSPQMQDLEVTYLQCLTFSALPMAVMASVASFFMGRSKTSVVMLLNGVGLVVNVVLNYAWIYGHWGFPEMGIAGAGWATVASSSVSALLGLALMLSPKYQAQYAILSGWRFDPPLFLRLMRFGLPSGLQWALDGLAFSIFSIFIGKMGDVELAANSIAFAINLLAFLPPMGIGQAVAVHVGQRLGETRPDLAERSTYMGFALGWIYMTFMGLTFVCFPTLYVAAFESQNNPEQWSQVAVMVPILLRFAAVFCLFDSLNMVFSFALKGAGDTRFVSIVSLALAWTFVVPPAYFIWRYDLGIYWAWASVTMYVVALAAVLLFRFRQGKWKNMRVIENAPEAASPESLCSTEELASEPALP
jgi:MATE family multidrug resistance protein